MLVKLLVFAPLFNAPKNHVLNYFTLEMAAIIVASRRHRRDCGVEGRGFFFAHVTYLECKKNMKISFAKPCYFYLLQEIKDNLEPSTKSHLIPGLLKILATPSIY